MMALILTGNMLPFNAGDALGSFNSWIRLVTGVLQGWASLWFPSHVERSFAPSNRRSVCADDHHGRAGIRELLEGLGISRSAEAGR
jgi:hypothetical protein